MISKTLFRHSRIAVFIGMLGLLLSSPATQVYPAGRDYVVLLHGLAGGKWCMKRVEWTLKRAGYRVINVGYASTRIPVEEVANRILPEALENEVTDPGARVHFVTFSLGGIVLRHYLGSHEVKNMGRIVMLGPPNQGSEVAERLRSLRLFHEFFGPAGQCLGTGEQSLPRMLEGSPGETGVIAGDRSINPLFSFWLRGPDDGKVSVESTRLTGMKDHLVVHGTHTCLPWRSDVLKATVQFLRAGSF